MLAGGTGWLRGAPHAQQCRLCSLQRCALKRAYPADPNLANCTLHLPPDCLPSYLDW